MATPVILDAYGTLFDVYAISAAAERAFAGHGDRLAEIWRVAQIDYTRIRTLSGQYRDFWAITRDALEFAAESLGLPLSDDVASDLMASYAKLTAFEENLSVLQRLQSRGHGLAILSNGTPQMLQSAVGAAGMDGVFTHVLSVDHVKQFKTADAAYQMALDAFGLPAKEMVFVSSNGWDICGATWFGFRTFWCNRAGRPLDRLGVRPAAEGRSLNDLETFLS